LVTNESESLNLSIPGNSREPELHATGGQRVYNLADVVADDAEPGGGCKLFYDSPEC